MHNGLRAMSLRSAETKPLPCPIKLLAVLWLGLSTCAGLAASGKAYGKQDASEPSGTNLNALIEKMRANIETNQEVAHQYVFDLNWHATTIKHGKVTWDESAKFVTVFVNGKFYHRKVEQNGKPLSAKQQLADMMRHEPINRDDNGEDFILPTRGANPPYVIRAYLPICCLASAFENRLIRNETVNGRDNLVVESVPRMGVNPISEEEKTAIEWKETTWIDAEDLMPTRYVAELLIDKRDVLFKGSTVEVDFVRLDPSSMPQSGLTKPVWLWHGQKYRGISRFGSARGVGTCEQTAANYKKLQSDMRLVDDSVREVPTAGGSKHP
jgi:hypothetical protein